MPIKSSGFLGLPKTSVFKGIVSLDTKRHLGKSGVIYPFLTLRDLSSGEIKKLLSDILYKRDTDVVDSPSRRVKSR